MVLIGRCTVWLLALVAVKLTTLLLESVIGLDRMHDAYRFIVNAAPVIPVTWALFWRGR